MRRHRVGTAEESAKEKQLASTLDERVKNSLIGRMAGRRRSRGTGGERSPRDAMIADRATHVQRVQLHPRKKWEKESEDIDGTDKNEQTSRRFIAIMMTVQMMVNR